ncbi:MAG: hypothetical protein M3P98_02630 [bacterium]|nr:hypothetical protein [bacterium]
MDSDAKDGWIIALGIAVFICAIGWYFDATTQDDTTQTSSDNKEDTSYRLELAEDRVLEYDDALSEANNNIEEGSSCVDEAYSFFNDAYFDDGMYQLDDCRRDTVDSPGTDI